MTKTYKQKVSELSVILNTSLGINNKEHKKQMERIVKTMQNEYSLLILENEALVKLNNALISESATAVALVRLKNENLNLNIRVLELEALVTVGL